MGTRMEEGSLEMISFQIISHVGTAKSLIMEALQAAKTGDFEQAKQQLSEADHYFIEGHKVHASLIQKEAAGEPVELSMLFMHAEDQLMSTETIATLVREMIDMYRRIDGMN